MRIVAIRHVAERFEIGIFIAVPERIYPSTRMRPA
jgi:hypothetical protein